MQQILSLLSVIALVTMIMFAVQAFRKRPGAGRKTWQAGLAVMACLVLSMLTGTLTGGSTSGPRTPPEARQTPAWDDSAAQQLAALMTGKGLDCIPAATGKSCTSDVAGVGNVTVALSENRVTVLISDPVIEARQFSPDLTEVSSQNIQIKEGPLAGYSVARIDTDTGIQFHLRNEASHQLDGN